MKNSAKKHIEAVVLDVDGTLIDSNDAHAWSWVEALAEANRPTPFGMLRRVVGMGADKILPLLTGLEESSDLGSQISRRRGEIFREKYLSKLRPFQGVRDLLERMRAEDLDLCIGTSASEKDLSALLEILEIKDLIQAEVTKADSGNSKPAPDTVILALKKMNRQSHHALMLGDTPYDIEAAIAAGVGAVTLRCSGWEDEKLGAALAIYDDPKDLLERASTSPLFVKRH